MLYIIFYEKDCKSSYTLIYSSIGHTVWLILIYDLAQIYDRILQSFSKLFKSGA